MIPRDVISTKSHSPSTLRSQFIFSGYTTNPLQHIDASLVSMAAVKMETEGAPSPQVDLVLSSIQGGGGRTMMPFMGGNARDNSTRMQMASPKIYDSDKPSRAKRRSPKTRWKKPKDMPRRPLSAYNIFFRKERERLLQGIGKTEPSVEPSDEDSGSSPVPRGVSSSDSSSDESAMKTKLRVHQKSSGIGFANLAKQVASRWKELEPDLRVEYEALASAEKARYNQELTVYRNSRTLEKEEKTPVSPPEELPTQEAVLPENVRSFASFPSTPMLHRKVLPPQEAVFPENTESFMSLPSMPMLLRRASDPFPSLNSIPTGPVVSRHPAIHQHLRNYFFGGMYIPGMGGMSVEQLTQASGASLEHLTATSLFQHHLHYQGRRQSLCAYQEPYREARETKTVFKDYAFLNQHIQRQHAEQQSHLPCEEENTETLPAFDDTFPNLSVHDVPPSCEDLDGTMTLPNDQELYTPLDAVPSTLRNIDTGFDNDTVDYLTTMKFEV